MLDDRLIFLSSELSVFGLRKKKKKKTLNMSFWDLGNTDLHFSHFKRPNN